MKILLNFLKNHIKTDALSLERVQSNCYNLFRNAKLKINNTMEASLKASKSLDNPKHFSFKNSSILLIYVFYQKFNYRKEHYYAR